MYVPLNPKGVRRLIGMLMALFVFVVGGNGTFLGFASSLSASDPQQSD